MAQKYDVIIAGGGHNGLVAGGYLAKAGMNVCVVEHQPFLGGGVVTRECTLPGFKHDIASTWHGMIQLNPLLTRDELGLKSKFGLKYLFSDDICMSIIFPDNSYFHFYKDIDKTCQGLAKYSQRDAEAYRKFYDFTEKVVDLMVMGMFSPPPSYATFASLLDASPEGQRILRSNLMSGMDIINELFEDPHTKIILGRTTGSMMIKPQSRGTGLAVFMTLPFLHKYGGGAFPVGGSGALSEALGKCIEYYGGTIRLSSTIKKFKISGDKVTGVILESGEEIEAKKAVVTNFNIKQIPAMIEDAKDIPEQFSEGVRTVMPSEFVGMQCNICLNEAPHWTCSEDASRAALVELLPDDIETFPDIYEGLSRGIPDTQQLCCVTPSIFDSTRAPDGKHTFVLYSFQPYALKNGGAEAWKEKGEEIYLKQLELVRRHTDNMGDDNILAKKIWTPLDIERRNPSHIRGDFAHIGGYLWQQSGCRPFFGYGQYRMPVKGLYLCGPSSHPGVGATGGGRAAVQVVFEDLGLDFEKVAGKEIK